MQAVLLLGWFVTIGASLTAIMAVLKKTDLL